MTTNISITKLNKDAVIPTRGSTGAAGYDLYSTESYTLKPTERKLFKTGISMSITRGMYGRIAPRSGLAYKNGIDVMAGVIDEDYRGEIGVILINLGQEDKTISAGDKIAQIIFEFYNEATFVESTTLDDTSRGSGGYGSTDQAPQKQTNKGLVIKDRTTVSKFFYGQNPAKIEMAKSYYSNFQGDIYVYEENGTRGLCVIDASGEILVKTPIEKIST